MELSSYKPSEKTEIKQLVKSAFSKSDGPEEGTLIADLTADLIDKTEDRDIFGFIAKENNEIIGSIFFTRMRFKTPIEAFILAPVAIDTKHQRKGIGQKLIRYGLEHIKEKGIKLAITYGDPNYYSKTGFQQITEDIIKAPQPLTQPEGWLCQSLDGTTIPTIPDKPNCVKALDKPEYW